MEAKPWRPSAVQGPAEVLVLRQCSVRVHPRGGLWPRDCWSLGLEADGGNFARLDELENFRGPDGRFELRLLWPGQPHLGEQRWWQRSNPYQKRSRGVDGYQPIQCDHTTTGWNGLQFDNSGNTLLSGSSMKSCSARKWFYALGAYRLWKEGFPGPDGSIVVHHVELWVRNPWVAAAPAALQVRLREESPDEALHLHNSWTDSVVGLLVRRTSGRIDTDAARRAVTAWVFEASTLPGRAETLVEPLLPRGDLQYLIAQIRTALRSERRQPQPEVLAAEVLHEVDRLVSEMTAIRSRADEYWTDESINATASCQADCMQLRWRLHKTLTCAIQDRLRLTRRCYERLVARYRKHGGDPHRMHGRMLVMLVRYAMLLVSDPGQHGALPVAVFECLKRDFDCSTECFANPLNALTPSFCSIFESDRCFGSLGNFFQLNPKSGSFEVNPPFNIKSAVVEDHLARMLGASFQPLSFVLFYPAPHWNDVTGMHALLRPFYRTHLTVRKGQHSYRAGNQHLRERLVTASHDTVVVFLQNKAGHKKWPPSPDRQRRLLEAFESSVAPRETNEAKTVGQRPAKRQRLGRGEHSAPRAPEKTSTVAEGGREVLQTCMAGAGTAKESKPAVQENNDPSVLDEVELMDEVSSILDHRQTDSTVEYKIRWKAYGPDDDTWEPEENLECPILLNEYWEAKAAGDVTSNEDLVLVDGGSRDRPIDVG